MTTRFVLYYWPIPFRAQGARYIMAHAGIDWEEPDRDAVTAMYQSRISDQPLPFMGPPVLHDRRTNLWLSQAPAICGYLGRDLGLMPGTPAGDALTYKVLGDGIDVLHALTLNCGAAMWTDHGWATFAETRLPRWLSIFEELGHRNGLGPDHGTLLGTPEPGVADLATAALWITICDKLPGMADLVARHAPRVLALSRRIADTSAISSLRATQTTLWGDVWCEGQIEASLRSVLTTWRD